MISYVIPLFDNSGTAVGIIGMDIDMSRITAMVDEIKLYDTGYAFLCDSNGNMVYHNRYPSGMTLEEIKKTACLHSLTTTTVTNRQEMSSISAIAKAKKESCVQNFSPTVWRS